MATYTIVAKGSLDPDDIRESPPGSNNFLVEADKAKDLINLQSGDRVYFSSSVDSNVKLSTDAGSPISVNFFFQASSNAGGYDFEVEDRIHADISIDSGTDLSDVNFNASNATSVSLTGGNNVQIGSFVGSAAGSNTLELGTDSVVFGSINTGSGGSASITVGDGSLITGNILTGSGGDTVDLETTEVLGSISVGGGNDTVLVSGHISGGIDLGTGDDTLEVASGSRVDGDVDGSDGADVITIGDATTFNGKFTAGNGNDTVTAGDNNTFNPGSSLRLGAGNDVLLFGDGNDVFANVNLGDGTNTATFGDGNNISAAVLGGAQADTIVFGSGNDVAGNIDTGNGNDQVTLGNADANGGSFNALLTGDGQDFIKVGNNLDWTSVDSGGGADTVIIGLFDNSVNRVIDGVSHDETYGASGDGDPSNDDTLRIAISNAEKAAFRTLLESNGYRLVDGVYVADADDPNLDFHLHWGNAEINDFENIQVVCFTRGTMIRAEHGDVPIETLCEGDFVETLDHGLQPIRWIRSTTVPAIGHLAPIHIAAGTLGNQRDLLVSPQHRMLLSGWQLELLFAEVEALAPAQSLLNDTTITRRPGGMVEYFHILFDTHEIIFAESCPCESFHPGQVGLDSMSEAVREEIFEFFPELRRDPQAYGPSARASLKRFEAEMARSMILASAPAVHLSGAA